MEDMSTELERELGKIIKKKHNTDFYIIQRFPMAVSWLAVEHLSQALLMIVKH